MVGIVSLLKRLTGAAGRVRAPMALAAGVLLVACGDHDMALDPATPPLVAQPARAVGLAGLVTGSMLQLYCDDGAPETVPLTARALRDGSVTWLGHAGFLIRIGGRSVIVDPILAESALTRFSLGGRLAEAPDLSGLDRLDAVLISHDDQDHLDTPTLRMLSARFPDAVLYVPEGLRAARFDTGFAEIVSVPAWQPVRLGAVTLTPAPVIHVGRRGLGVTSPAVGWQVRGPGGALFFAGDSAYGPQFDLIEGRLGPVDLAIVPIGAYEPRRLVGNMHSTPEQAIEMAIDLGARRVVPHHWGTFALSPDSPAEATARFRAAAAGRVVPLVLPVGGTACVRG